MGQAVSVWLGDDVPTIRGGDIPTVLKKRRRDDDDDDDEEEVVNLVLVSVAAEATVVVGLTIFIYGVKGEFSQERENESTVTVVEQSATELATNAHTVQNRRLYFRGVVQQ